MNKKSFVLGVIPARGGSKEVPRKNLKYLAGKPLIEYSITEAKQSRLLSDFIVSTDDQEIANIAKELGASVPFIRPMHLATDLALAVDTMIHAVSEYENLNKVKVDILVMLQPTAPLRKSKDIDESIKKLISNDAESVISVVDVNNFHPFKMKRIVGGCLVDFIETGLENPPRQQLPATFIVNGAIYAVKRDVLVEKKSFKGDKSMPYIMSTEDSVNIDGEIDFYVAEKYLRERGD